MEDEEEEEEEEEWQHMPRSQLFRSTGREGSLSMWANLD